MTTTPFDVATHPVALKLQAISNEMNAVLFERRSAIEAILLTLIAKQHCFLLGPPGVAKSYLIRELMGHITGARYFESLLSRTRADSAILGPYDLKELRDNGNQRRKIDGYLLTCDYAMLDEIGKMSPTLGHDMLAALNERLRHEVADGNSAHAIPLRSAFTASNEMVNDESDDASALFDRLLVRVVVDRIQESGNFAHMLTNIPDRTDLTVISLEEIADVTDNIVPNIPVPQDVILSVIELREQLRAKGIEPSDRRWKQSIRILQANAFLTGNETVSEDDIQVLRYTLWDTPAQIKDVERTSAAVANPILEDLSKILDGIEEIRGKIYALKGEAESKKASSGAEFNGKLKQAFNQLKDLRRKCEEQGRSTVKVTEARSRIQDVADLCYVECLGMDPGVVAAERKSKED